MHSLLPKNFTYSIDKSQNMDKQIRIYFVDILAAKRVRKFIVFGYNLIFFSVDIIPNIFENFRITDNLWIMSS